MALVAILAVIGIVKNNVSNKETVVTSTTAPEVTKNVIEKKPVEEPTAFDEEAIKKPVFELPSLDGGNKKEEKKEEEEEEEIPEEQESEESAPVEQEVVADGQPVLQLQPIFDGAASGDSTPAAPANGGLSGLSRL